MQFMPRTWDEVMGPDASPFEPSHAIQAACKYIHTLRRIIRTPDWPAVWAAYNWGPGSVRQHLKGHGFLNQPKLPNETRFYIERIERVLAKITEDPRR
jgi:hypothetical protein